MSKFAFWRYIKSDCGYIDWNGKVYFLGIQIINVRILLINVTQMLIFRVRFHWRFDDVFVEKTYELCIQGCAVTLDDGIEGIFVMVCLWGRLVCNTHHWWRNIHVDRVDHEYSCIEVEFLNFWRDYLIVADANIADFSCNFINMIFGKESLCNINFASDCELCLIIEDCSFGERCTSNYNIVTKTLTDQQKSNDFAP